MKNPNERISRFTVIGLSAALALLGVLLLVPILVSGGWHLVLLHLIGGFYFFLKHNLSGISTNADTWIPGLAAFLLASLIAHLLCHRWSARRKLRWPVSNTLCIALLLPVLFTIAFIVPGVLLQVDSLRSTPWFEHSRNPVAEVHRELETLWMDLIETATKHPRKQLPESIARIPDSVAVTRRLISRRQTDLPVEPIIYLGAGRDLSSDGSVPILISAPYRDKGNIMRQMITLGGDIIAIADSETVTWLNQVLPP